MKVRLILLNSTTPAPAPISRLRMNRDTRPLSIGYTVKARRGNGSNLDRGCITALETGNDFVRDSQCVDPGGRNSMVNQEGQRTLDGHTPIWSSSNRLQAQSAIFFVAPEARKPQARGPLDDGFRCISEGQPTLPDKNWMSGFKTRFQRVRTGFFVAPGARKFDPDFDRKSPIPLPLRRGNCFDIPKRYISVPGAVHTVLSPVHALPLREFGLPRLMCWFRAPGATRSLSGNQDIRLLDGDTPLYARCFRCPTGGATAFGQLHRELRPQEPSILFGGQPGRCPSIILVS